MYLIMSSLIVILISMLILLKQLSVAAITVRKFVYQKDMSEHCKRGVMPSVFLGRHVVDAYSKILQFSRVAIPYSCYITVRTESGSNIILVIQLLSDKSLETSCKENSNQLLVYRMGETFGGYWGPLPDLFRMTEAPSNTKPTKYTLKTRPPTTSSKQKIKKNAKSTQKYVKTIVTKPRQDYITIEIPIVNVSGKFVTRKHETLEKALEKDETFDFIYDVLPWRGISYQTSLLPVMQFSLKKSNSERVNAATSRFQIDFGYGKYTPDFRLTFPTQSRFSQRTKLFPRFKPNVNRRIHFRKNKTPLLRINNRHLDRKLKKSNKKLEVRRRIPQNIKAHKINSEKIVDVDQYKTWKLIEELMAELNKSKVQTTEEDSDSKDTIDFLKKISNMKHNISAYLYTKADFNKPFVQISDSMTENTPKPYTKRPSSLSHSKNDFDDHNKSTHITSEFTHISAEMEIMASEKNFNQNENDYTNEKSIQSITSKSYDKKINTANSELQKSEVINEDDVIINFPTNMEADVSTNPSTGSLVDHESWENVVQAAPVMAVMLNQKPSATPSASPSSTRDIHSEDKNRIEPDTKNVTNHGFRKKRYIQAISIQNARPHNVTTRQEVPTTESYSYHVSDIQEFAQLIELRDDERQERVALRYLRYYMGPNIFNICDYETAKSRQVYLFNSSRIVIAITNFTMERMMVVMTPARTLLNGETRCTGSNLECQVAGTRVCIDSMTACDGVPNCGAYDIYDEDRLMCGAAVGLQHNVYLAATTFLAVMLTILYAVHYWLKRCVPKVSEAFFIYSNGDENILYLDSIMRSPHDLYDEPRSPHPNFFDEDILGVNDRSTRSRKFFRTWLRKILKCNFKNKNKEAKVFDEISDNAHICSRKMYSFTEFEISKMLGKKPANVSTQTGDSLEMKNLELSIKCDSNDKLGKVLSLVSSIETHHVAKYNTRRMGNEDSQRHSDELSILKFFKDARHNDSLDTINCNRRSNCDGIELTSASYPGSEAHADEEREIKNYYYESRKSKDYDHLLSPVIISTDTIESYIDKKPPRHILKQLRFEKETTAIPSVEDYEYEGDSSVSESRRLEHGHERHRRIHALETIGEDEDTVPSSSRDFKLFWGGSKGHVKRKKTKKKSQMPLR